MIAIVALGGVLNGCAGGGGDGGGGGGGQRPQCTPPAVATVCFSTNVQPLFDKSCALAGCHSPPSSQAGLDLTAGRSYGEIIRVRSTVMRNELLVVLGKPDESYFVRKIEGGPNIAGELMPLRCEFGTPLNGAVCLTAGEMAAIRQWVVECAQNNECAQN